MRVNSHKPHLVVLPEDDENRQLAEGFLLNPSISAHRVQVLKPESGWSNLLTRFKSDHVPRLERYPDRFMVLLIDFDGHNDRLEHAKQFIPLHLTERVFILGVQTEPEDLKTSLGHISSEKIGKNLAEDCRNNTNTLWEHDLLKHNADELARLQQYVRPILFEET